MTLALLTCSAPSRAEHVDRWPLDNRDRLERANTRAPREEVLRVDGNRLVRRERLLADDDEAIGVWERQRFQQHRVDEREDGRVRADAQRQRQEGDRCEAGRPAERAERVARVLHDAFDEVEPTCVAALFLPLIDAAKLAQRREARLLVRHSAGAQHFNLTIEVIAHLLVELGLDSSASEYERSRMRSSHARIRPRRYHRHRPSTFVVDPSRRS